MSTFRDAIAEAACGAWDRPGRFIDEDVADAVLDMPEMQAIRKALRVDADLHSIVADMTPAEWLRKIVRLPQSVIAWVLDGET
jgi:hypothetical protein